MHVHLHSASGAVVILMLHKCKADFCLFVCLFESHPTKVRVAGEPGEIQLPRRNQILTRLAVKTPPKALDEGTSSI